MAQVSPLPPVPKNPVRPPSVRLVGEEAWTLDTVDGERLEARGRVTATASRVVVLCHPHPLYGGTMHNAVIVALARRLLDGDPAEVSFLRFNFRGVEASSGVHLHGVGEKLDVLAAIDGVLNISPSAQVTVVGYSFGSWVGLRAAWEHPEVQRVALIAPAVRVLNYEEAAECRRPLPTEVVVGDRDEFVDVTQARTLARSIGARLHVIDGADHFFVGHRRLVTQTILPFIAPEMAQP